MLLKREQNILPHTDRIGAGVVTVESSGAMPAGSGGTTVFSSTGSGVGVTTCVAGVFRAAVFFAAGCTAGFSVELSAI